jgi:hypothetical protein
VGLIEGTRIYLFDEEGGAELMQFPDRSNVPIDMLFPPDGSYFRMLSRFIDSEIVEPNDLAETGMKRGSAR